MSKYSYAVYLHKELLLEGPLVVVADHQGPDLLMVLRVNPEQAAAFWSEAPLVEAGHVEVNSEVVDSKLGLELKVVFLLPAFDFEFGTLGCTWSSKTC